ncbi:MAG: repeat-containing protein YrrB, partial [Verrucomicrobiota bacterium]
MKFSLPTFFAPGTAAAAVTPRQIRLAGALLVLATVAVYLNSLFVPFLYDDNAAIVENRTIRQLSPLLDAMRAPPGTTPEGRPLLNLSLALNHRLGGLNVVGYHVANILLHALAGLALFGLVRRALLLPRWSEHFAPVALPLALGAAALWTLHPLQTESVTYIVQRAESLMGLFYLLTLYAFVRSLDETRAELWQTLSVGACLLGMASKEVMASAPIVVLLFDRAFVAGTLREAWTRRRGYYLALAATWLLLAALVLGAGGNRNGAVGLGVATGFWKWWLTQPEALARYLQLSLWPHPLVFDYDTHWVRGAAAAQPWAFFILPLVGWLLVDAVRRPARGFFGLMALAILAPTSLIPGTTQMIVEHRMYLALAPLLVLVVLALHRRFGARAWPLVAALAVAAGALTVVRNTDYATPLGLWKDALAKRPDNAVAHVQAANIYYAQGQAAEAAAHLLEAIRVRPDYALAHHNLGQVLGSAGRTTEAIRRFQASIELEPTLPISYAGLGTTLAQMGRTDAGIGYLKIAVRLDPKYPTGQLMLGLALYRAGRIPEAIAACERAVDLAPDDPIPHNYLANALVAAGRLPEAQAHLEVAVKLRDSNYSARFNLGRVLLARENPADARPQFEAAIRLQPRSAEAHFFLGETLTILGDAPGAKVHYTATVRLVPDHTEARARLGLGPLLK